MAKALGAGASGIIAGPANQRPTIATATEADPAFVQSYNTYYAALDPIAPRAMALPFGSVLTRSMILSQHEINRSEFYNDWARPQNFGNCMVAKFVAGATDGLACLTFCDDEPLAAAFRMMELLAPHLRVAAETRSMLQGLSVERDTALEALARLGQAALFVDGAGRVLHANAAAEAMLRRNDGLSGGANGLVAGTAALTAELRRLIARAAGRFGVERLGGSVRLPRPSGEPPLVATVSPIQASHAPLTPSACPEALVLVAAPRQTASAVSGSLRDLFGLTPAEAAVALGIAAGRGVNATAAELGVAASTVRTHLHRVFGKTGVRRQAELSHLIGAISSPVAHEAR